MLRLPTFHTGLKNDLVQRLEAFMIEQGQGAEPAVEEPAASNATENGVEATDPHTATEPVHISNDSHITETAAPPAQEVHVEPAAAKLVQAAPVVVKPVVPHPALKPVEKATPSNKPQVCQVTCCEDWSSLNKWLNIYIY